MRIHKQPGGSVLVRYANAFEFHTLWQLPELASTAGHDGAENRLYPPPFAAEEATPEQQEDWDEYVRPELEELFGTSFAHVLADLEKAARDAPPEPREFPVRKPRRRVPQEPVIVAPAPPEILPPRRAGEPPATKPPAAAPPPQKPEAPALWTFAIPAEHVEDWFRAMNAARLVLSERHDCHRDDFDYVLRMFNSGNVPYHQYRLLTGMCGWWVEALMR
jgi:hypothetical protein